MKKALLAALVLAIPVAFPNGATGHPTSGTGGFGGSQTWLTPDAEEGEQSTTTAAPTNEGQSKNLKVLASIGKGKLKNFNSDLAFWGDYAIMGNYDGF